MSTVHVHIGGAKTGTTTVQTVFMLSRDALARRGYWYPWAAGKRRQADLVCAMEPDLGSPRHVARGVTTSDEWRAYRDAFIEAFDSERAAHPGADAILSSEHLLYLSREGVAEIEAFLGARFDRVRVYYYFRNPVDFEISIYSTRMKSGKAQHFRDVDTFNTPERHRLVQRWERAFGEDAVDVAFFERSRLRNGSIVDDLLTRMGIDPAIAVLPQQDKNEALDMTMLEILRHVNSGLLETLGHGRSDRWKLVRQLAKLSSKAPPRVSPETAERINEAYRETVACFSRRSGVPAEDILKTERVSTQGPTLESYALTPEDIVPILVRLALGAPVAAGSRGGALSGPGRGTANGTAGDTQERRRTA